MDLSASATTSRRSPSQSDWGWSADAGRQSPSRVRATRTPMDDDRRRSIGAPNPACRWHRCARAGSARSLALAVDRDAGVELTQWRHRELHRKRNLRSGGRLVIDRMSGRVALLIVAVAVIAIFLLGWFVLLSPERSKVSKL